MADPQKKIPYMEILKRALGLATARKNRFLWWFGFFVALSGITAYFDPLGGKNLLQNMPALPYPRTTPGLMLFFVIALLLIAIGILGRGALIRSLDNLVESKKTAFNDGIDGGKNNFWKIFFISFSLNLFNVAILMILASPVAFLFYGKAFLIGTLLGIIAALILVPLLFLTFFLRTFGYLYAVLGPLSVWNSLENSYELLIRNWRSAIIMSILFIPIYIAALSILVISLVPLALIFIMLGFISFLIVGNAGAAIISTLGIILVFSIVLAIKSALAVFAQAVWLLYFREIAGNDRKEEMEEKESVIETLPVNPMENI